MTHRRDKTRLSDDGLLSCTSSDLTGGVQRLYRWGRYGLSLIDSPMAHNFPFAWEAAVIEFPRSWDNKYMIMYKTPLTKNVEVFKTTLETNKFIAKAKRWALRHSKP